MMSALFSARILQLALRLGVGGLFLYAAFPKVLNPAEFAMAVRGYKIIPFAYSNAFAVALSWGELVAALMLVLGILTRKAAAAIFLLLVVFIAAIGTTLVRGMVVDCGCFGEGGSNTSWLLIVRNVAMLFGMALVIRYNDGSWSLFPGKRRR